MQSGGTGHGSAQSGGWSDGNGGSSRLIGFRSTTIQISMKQGQHCSTRITCAHRVQPTQPGVCMHDTCFSCCACSFSCSALATTTACFAAVSTRLSPLYPSATVVAVALSLVCSALRLSTCAGDMRRRWSLAWHQKAKEVASRDPPPEGRDVVRVGLGMASVCHSTRILFHSRGDRSVPRKGRRCEPAGWL